MSAMPQLSFLNFHFISTNLLSTYYVPGGLQGLECSGHVFKSCSPNQEVGCLVGDTDTHTTNCNKK